MSDDESLIRPATPHDLLTLISALNERNVPYLLIGGFAMVAHGFERSTRDIDIMFPANAADGKKVKDVLLLMPEKAASELDPAWFAEGENIRLVDAYCLDIMLNANGETYESLLPYFQEVELGGLPVKTVTMQGLLRTKLTDREKDIPDRLFLDRKIAELTLNPVTFQDSPPDPRTKFDRLRAWVGGITSITQRPRNKP